jgi:Ca2+/Na+ antiporter
LIYTLYIIIYTWVSNISFLCINYLLACVCYVYILKMSKKIKVKKKKDANGISFKNRLKGHINWRKVRNFIIIW